MTAVRITFHSAHAIAFEGGIWLRVYTYLQASFWCTPWGELCTGSSSWAGSSSTAWRAYPPVLSSRPLSPPQWSQAHHTLHAHGCSAFWWQSPVSGRRQSHQQAPDGHAHPGGHPEPERYRSPDTHVYTIDYMGRLKGQEHSHIHTRKQCLELGFATSLSELWCSECIST